MFRRFLPALILLWLGFTPALRAQLRVDALTAVQSALARYENNPPPVTGASTVEGENILGGERDVVVVLNDVSTHNDGVRVDVAEGRLRYRQDASSTGRATIVYDGADGDAVNVDSDGLGGLDLTQGGLWDALRLTVEKLDKAVTIGLLITKTATDVSEIAVDLQAPITSTTTIDLPFSDFVVSGGAGADFTQVGSIILAIGVGGIRGSVDLEMGPVEATTTIVTGDLAISGQVRENVNYSGGAGAFVGNPVPNATIELYASDGAFRSSTTTDGSGRYQFTDLPADTYTVRAVDRTVVSTRPKNAGAEGALIPVQTFRTDFSGGTRKQVGDKIGGEAPSKEDAAANTGGLPLGGLTTATTTAQSITTVLVTDGNQENVDFGFNFDTIVNTNPTGQGSLNQFIVNANGLGNTGLAQSGRSSGTETSIFMIPSSSDPLGRPVDAGFSNGIFTISPAGALPPITEPVDVDGLTQTDFSGDTNAAGPEVEINGSSAGAGANGLTFSVSNCSATGLRVTEFAGNGIESVGAFALGTAGENSVTMRIFKNEGDGVSAEMLQYIGLNKLYVTENGGSGIRATGNVTLDEVFAENNGEWGAESSEGNIVVLNTNFGANFFQLNGHGGVRAPSGIVAIEEILAENNGGSSSGENLGHGVQAKELVWKGGVSSRNRNDGIRAETMTHDEDSDDPRVRVRSNGGDGIHVDGSVSIDGVIAEQNGGWGVLSESGDVLIRETGSGSTAIGNKRGGVSAANGTLRATRLLADNNGESAGLDGHGLIGNEVFLVSVGASDNKGDGVRAGTLRYTKLFESDRLVTSVNGGDGVRVTEGSFTADGFGATDNGGWGLRCEKGDAVILDAGVGTNLIGRNAKGGLLVPNGKLTATDLTADRNGTSASGDGEGFGIRARDVDLTGASASNNKNDGIRATNVTARPLFGDLALILTANEGDGLEADGTVTINGVRANQNFGSGIKAAEMDITNGHFSDNNSDGARSLRARINSGFFITNGGYGVIVTKERVDLRAIMTRGNKRGGVLIQESSETPLGKIQNASVSIEGSQFLENEGHGIELTTDVDLRVAGSNFSGNQDFAVSAPQNTSPVIARRNWWGDASGPAGAGAGNGDPVSTGVDFSDWLETPVGVVASAAADTVTLPAGQVDSVDVYFQNWANLDDSLSVTVSDSLGWITGPMEALVSFRDSLGGLLRVGFAVPSGAPTGTLTRVNATATSTADPQNQGSVQFYVSAGSRPVAVEDDAELPSSSLLLSSYPNPFHTATTLDIENPEPAYVRLDIFDAAGRFVRQLVSQRLEAGTHHVSFVTSDLATGVYFARLTRESQYRVIPLFVAR